MQAGAVDLTSADVNTSRVFMPHFLLRLFPKETIRLSSDFFSIIHGHSIMEKQRANAIPFLVRIHCDILPPPKEAGASRSIVPMY